MGEAVYSGWSTGAVDIHCQPTFPTAPLESVHEPSPTCDLGVARMHALTSKPTAQCLCSAISPFPSACLPLPLVISSGVRPHVRPAARSGNSDRAHAHLRLFPQLLAFSQPEQLQGGRRQEFNTYSYPAVMYIIAARADQESHSTVYLHHTVTDSSFGQIQAIGGLVLLLHCPLCSLALIVSHSSLRHGDFVVPRPPFPPTTC